MTSYMEFMIYRHSNGSKVRTDKVMQAQPERTHYPGKMSRVKLEEVMRLMESTFEHNMSSLHSALTAEQVQKTGLLKSWIRFD